VAYAQESVPDVLRRVAPSVVRIKVGDELGSGFVYPTARHVTTSYTLVNHEGELELVLGGGKRLHARVAAWSEADDVAILELPRSLGSAPLQLEPASGFAGQDVILLGRPTLVDPEAVDEPVRRDVPTPRFGKVGVASATQVNVDVATWRGDVGAPIITSTGRVLGVVSGRTERRLGLVDTASAGRIEAVRKQIGK
jgi:S1-C subfamily serine protease